MTFTKVDFTETSFWPNPISSNCRAANRAESFSEYVVPPGLEILLILVSTNRPLLTELGRRGFFRKLFRRRKV
jgi:hypothetical protein